MCPFAPRSFHGSSQRTAACSTGSEERRSGLHTRTASGIPISLRLHTSIPPRNFPRKPEPQSERSRARLRRSLVPCGRRNARSKARTRAGPPAPVPLPRGKKILQKFGGGRRVRWLDLTQTRGPSRVLGIFKIKEEEESRAAAAPRLRNWPRDGSGDGPRRSRGVPSAENAATCSATAGSEQGRQRG